MNLLLKIFILLLSLNIAQASNICDLLLKQGSSSERVLKAYETAKKMHMGQVRKISGTPYLIHPDEVAQSLLKYTKDEDMLIAALLHDTLEDTTMTFFDIEKLFGSRAAKLVQELTSDPVLLEQMGKAQYLRHKLNYISDDALLIKLLDRLNNTKDLGKGSKAWRKQYASDTKFMLDGLERKLNANQQEVISLIKKQIAPFI